jgi:hypothetical protein
MGGHNVQQKKARQQGDKFLIKTATATLTVAEVLADVTIQAEKATAMTLTMPATITSLAGVFGEIINAGAGVLTVSYTAQSGAATATLNQDDKVGYIYDEDGKCYVDSSDTAIGLNITPADVDTGGALALEGSVALVTVAAETRTLAIPAAVGDMLALTLDVYAVGDCVVTVASAINGTGNNTLTFGTVGDSIVLYGVQVAGAPVWRVMANDAVALSTV